jgi:hypothetical protein
MYTFIKLDTRNGKMWQVQWSNKGKEYRKYTLIGEDYRVAKGDIIVGVVGYPNVGKSSVINALTFKKKAKVSTKAGTTHGVHWIASGESSPNTLAYSTNGTQWIGLGTTIFSSSSTSSFVLYSNPNSIAYSSNGMSWIGLGTSTFSVRGYDVIVGNNIFVWSDDHFGERISSGFNNNGACVFHGINVDLFYEVLPSLDFIFLCDYDETKSYFDGINPVFSIEKIKKINSKLGIVHLYGTINSELLLNEGFNVYPRKNGYSKYMTETLSYSGQIPVLKLLTAGFKVGQELTEGKYSTLTQILN